MDEETYQLIKRNLAASIRAFPNCRVASCECNSRAGEWQVDCTCPCHWYQMPGGMDGEWTLAEVAEQAKIGRPIDS